MLDCLLGWILVGANASSQPSRRPIPSFWFGAPIRRVLAVVASAKSRTSVAGVPNLRTNAVARVLDPWHRVRVWGGVLVVGTVHVRFEIQFRLLLFASEHSCTVFHRAS